MNDEPREFQVRMTVGENECQIDGQLTFAQLKDLIDAWLRTVTTGATPAEQAALAARATEAAGKMHEANERLGALGSDTK